jgi:hypothetical protein
VELAVLALATLAAALAADPQPLGTIRATAALGHGDFGVSGYLGVEGEGWLNERFALGGRISAGEQALMFGRSRDAILGEVQFIGGTHSGSTTLLGGLGLGVASIEEHPGTGLCISTCTTASPPTSSASATLSLMAGAIFRYRQLAFSATARAQFLGGGWDLLATLGLGVAF